MFSDNDALGSLKCEFFCDLTHRCYLVKNPLRSMKVAQLAEISAGEHRRPVYLPTRTLIFCLLYCNVKHSKYCRVNKQRLKGLKVQNL